MIDLFGKRDNGRTHCDGYSRRDFLKIGGMAAGGLSLSQLLELEAAQKTGRSHKAVINIYLPGALRIWISSISSRMRPRKFAVSLIRSRPMCRAWKSARCFRGWPRWPISFRLSVHWPTRMGRTIVTNA